MLRKDLPIRNNLTDGSIAGYNGTITVLENSIISPVRNNLGGAPGGVIVPPLPAYPDDGTITTEGLLVNYDFSEGISYGGSGSTVTNAIYPGVYNGAIVNNPSFSSSFGGALDLVRSSNQAVDIGDNLDDIFTGSSSKFSLEVWCKFNTLTPNTIYALLTKNGDGNFSENQRQFTFQVRNATGFSFGGIRLDFVYFGALNGTAIRGVRGDSTIISTGNVYHLVATFDNSISSGDGINRVQLYINSVLESKALWLTTGTHSSIPDGTARLGLCGQFGTTLGPINTIDGQIYSASVYNTVLSQSDVSYNWEGKRAKFGL